MKLSSEKKKKKEKKKYIKKKYNYYYAIRRIGRLGRKAKSNNCYLVVNIFKRYVMSACTIVSVFFVYTSDHYFINKRSVYLMKCIGT